jgi:hypothetical protein
MAVTALVVADTEGAVNGVGTSLSREQADAADRAAFLGGMTDEDEKPAAPVETADSDEDTDLDDLESDDVELDDEEPSVEDDSEDELDDDKDKSPERQKLLDAARRREQRGREALDRERKTFEGERDSFIAQWKPRVEAAERFEALKARGVNAYNIVDVLRELNVDEGEFEEAGRTIFAASKTGSADPKNKEAVARAREKREMADRLAAIEKERAEEKAAAKKAAEEAETQRAVEKYLDGIAKAAPAGSLAAHFLEKNPKQTRHVLGRVAQKLWEKNGEQPTPKAIHAAYEKYRAKELRGLGIDPAALTKAKAAAPAKTESKRIVVAANGKKPAAKKPDDEEKPLTREAFMRGEPD